MEQIRKIINDILISKTHRKNEKILISLIPELFNMVKFDHNHPHHHLDVWKHTLLTLDNLDSDDLATNIAALFHDIGKPFSYQDEEIRHFKGHALVSEDITRISLNRLEYDSDFINEVLFLVRYHDTNSEELGVKNPDIINKLLDLQYADAKAHHPNYVDRRIKKLDKIQNIKKYDTIK